ncbi:hypothetical protein Poli38472_008332 [Pythium oligandrum]|uniref:Nucleolus and neural progenitor protein-like N-terminal domain-containing protein n=1 Tax=Pythium oligandrum TaxID=41045 RepID=A0A8K1CN75_PYTOL|nr:hypothetical protein Poli38472_008332 [Pythium oligandrum]|eukprot:TMW65690.1 hypothetical protein Poli38472_008332 [Pythium oligandrum]
MATMEMVDSAEAMTTLQRDLRSADDVLRTLKEEIGLFQRSMYKNHSQHRRAAFYKHLQEVKRYMRDLSIVEMEKLFGDARDVVAQLELQDGEHHVSWKALSGDLKVTIDAVLRRFVTFAQGISGVIQAAQKAYKYPLNQRSTAISCPDLEMTCCSLTALCFSPFILARLTLLFKTLLIRAIEGHGGITLIYLNEVTKSNPLRARVTAIQLSGYRIPADAIAVANT